MLKPLTTQIVGSYAKPRWLARHERLGTYDGSWWRPEPDVLDEAREDAVRLAVYEQERAGLDLVTDGEQQRSAYDRHFLLGMSGIDFEDLEAESIRDETETTRRRSADELGEFGRLLRLNPRVKHELRWRWPVAVDELRTLKRHARTPVKANVPGPLTLATRLSDGFYPDEEALVMALAAALNEELKALDREGAAVLQIDEPAFHGRLSLARRVGVAAITRMVEGVLAPVIVHACYGYAIAFKFKEANPAYAEVLELLSSCPIAGISVEYEQPGHDPSLLRHCGDKHVLVGLLDLGSERVESAEHVAARIRAALDVVPPERLHPCSDCGMWFIPRDRAFAKVSALVQGTSLVRRELHFASV